MLHSWMEVKFDFSKVPADAEIKTATLTVNNVYKHNFKGDMFYVQRITEPWTEMGINWNNRPTFTSDKSNRAVCIDAEKKYVFTVTSEVKDMIANPSKDFGFVMKTDVNQCQTTLASREHPTVEGPRLDIVTENTPINKKIVKNTEQTLSIIKKGKNIQLYLPFNEACKISVYDLQGREITSQKALGNNSWYNLDTKLRSGSYFLKVQSNDRSWRSFVTVTK